MKSKILTIAMMGVSIAITSQEKTYTGIELNGGNPTSSVNGFRNKIQFTAGAHGAIVFNPGKADELMFGFHSNKRFYWGTGRSASKPNFYSMILHGETGNLYLPGNIGIGESSPNESLTVSKSGASIGIYDTNPLSKANNRIARYGNSLVIQNDLSGSWTDNINFHDTGNIGIGTRTPTEAKMVIKSSTLPSLSGNKTGAIAVIGRNTELAMGASSKLNGGGWIQTRHNSPTYDTYAYPLSINPLGGNVGIGTDTPAARLDIKGDIIIDNNSNANLYTGTGTTDNNRFLNILNSPNHKSASGIKTGGLLISDSFNYANPSKNQLIVKGGVGIGTNTPKSKLQVDGNIALGPQGGTVMPAFSRESGQGGLQISRIGTNNGSVVNHLMTIKGGGNVGIGTTNPTEAKLVIKSSTLPSLSGNKTGAIAVMGYNTELAIGASSELNGGSWIQTRHSSTTYPNHAYPLALNPLGGNVGIGTTDTKGFKLGVNGNIAATEVKVATYNNWADFVFENTYELPTLKEVENHIIEKGHLKDIPSAEEVSKNGFYLGQMDAKLLQKIEELTLYTIQQEKKIQKLEKENTQLKTINEQLLDIQNRLKSLEDKK
ncbi:autotransporter outer membrane beta-barrel domain-containing protein [Tenacibaculum xiamenense]|uniref:hypothetical protein n=1 Tax=Tenacibaculum xiamenense TaxID=1261553 RepID=UPI003893402F